jgi:hypothetical protein
MHLVWKRSVQRLRQRIWLAYSHIILSFSLNYHGPFTEICRQQRNIEEERIGTYSGVKRQNHMDEALLRLGRVQRRPPRARVHWHIPAPGLSTEQNMGKQTWDWLLWPANHRMYLIC